MPEETREEDLRLMFRKCGHITRVFLKMSDDRTECLGFAFVSFEIKADAEKAIETVDGHRYANRVLRVEMSM